MAAIFCRAGGTGRAWDTRDYGVCYICSKRPPTERLDPAILTEFTSNTLPMLEQTSRVSSQQEFVLSCKELTPPPPPNDVWPSSASTLIWRIKTRLDGWITWQSLARWGDLWRFELVLLVQVSLQSSLWSGHFSLVLWPGLYPQHHQIISLKLGSSVFWFLLQFLSCINLCQLKKKSKERTWKGSFECQCYYLSMSYMYTTSVVLPLWLNCYSRIPLKSLFIYFILFSLNIQQLV